MEWKLTQADYDRFVVVRESTNDYDESGYAAVVKDAENALILNIGHCSCYGTFNWNSDPEKSELDGGNVEWQGTLEELLSMARRKADPTMPSRTANKDEYAGNYLFAMYQSLLEHYKIAE